MSHTTVMKVPVSTQVDRNSLFFLGGIVGVVTVALLLLKISMGTGASPPSPVPALLPPGAEEPAGPRHYAVVCSGFTKTTQHAKWFGNSSAWIYRVLNKQYGYPDESIYFLYDDPSRSIPNGPVVVDGQMNRENFQKVMQHLGKQIRPGDTLSLFMIGHGIYRNGDSWFDCVGKDLSSTEFAELLSRVKTKEIRVVLSPCQMEGFIWRASKKGRVILSSTRFTENNSAAVAEAAIRGFSNMKFDENKDGRLSFAEAYQSVVQEQTQWYEKRGMRQREHALLDDNGDGMGHYLPADPESGDGHLSKNTFLGNQGKEIRLSRAWIQKLAERNESLNLTRFLDPYSDGRRPARNR